MPAHEVAEDSNVTMGGWLRRGMRRLSEAGVELPFRLRDVRRGVSRRMREIGQALRLRGDAAREAIKKPYRGLLRVTGRMVRQAQRAAAAAHEQLDKLPVAAREKVEHMLAALEPMVPRARQVVRQTRLRVFRGVSNSEGKLISLFVGVVPEKADAPLLVPSVRRRLEVLGHAPQVLATDRGFYSTDGEQQVVALGVRHAVLPKLGHRSRERIAHEQQRWFRRGRAWRAGGEARISRLKHQFGMARSRYRGQGGMARTVYWAAIVNNLVAVGRRRARADERSPRGPP